MISLVTMKSSLQVAAMLTACLFSLSIAQKCNTVTQIGLADENIIPSDSIITSSEKEDHEKDKIRFDCCQGTYGQAWCPADGDANPFVEIHLSNPVAIGQIKIQPPTTLASPANYFYPDKFMKTFDLFFKLEGIHDLVRVAEDITAIPNKTVTMAVLSLNPSLQTDIIRIEPNQYEKEPCFRLELYQCDVASMCPTNFCQNGGVCAGENTCDCTSTLHYGEMCQYTKTQIPVEIYTFLQIVNQLLITTAHNFTFQGQVSLLNSAGLKYILVPPKAIVDLTGTDIDSCLSHIDSCTSGFTIRVDFSFSKIVTTETQIVLTTGAVFEAGVNGILFYFNAGRVFCYVLTSSQAWHVLETFTLTENKWYGMIISWSPGTGLVLLEGSNVLGSSFMPSAVNAPNSKPLTIGYSVLTTTAELRLKSLIIVPLFWREVFRAGISLDIETTAEPTATTTTPVPTTPWVPVCQQTLGMADGTIIPSQIMASSFVAGHGIEKLRAGCCQGEEDGGWCADPNDSNPWVQVTFPDPKAIAAINFQLPERVDNTVIPANYVKTVRVEYRDVASNSTDMEIYSQNIPATYNATVAYSIGLKPSIVTDTLRMYITSSEGNACFRFELKGCKPEDLCQPNFCGNSGKCMGQNRCQCPANFYGERCQLTGEDVAETEIGFKDKSNSTITTTDSNTTLTTSGNVSLVKMDNKQIIQLTDGGTVTFPFDRCLQDLNKCGAGFTITFVVSLLAITDDELVIATSGGHKPNAQGMSIVYNKREQKLFFRVTTSAQTWTVTTSFTWHENTWYRLTVSWSPATGVKLIVNSVLIGSTVGSDPVSISDSKPGPLCLGCGVQTTITIRIKVVFIAHVFINDLVKADIIESISRPTSPQPATTTTTTTTTSTLAPTTLPTPENCNPEDLNPQDTLAYNLTFLNIIADKFVVTPDNVMTVYGNPVLTTDKLPGIEMDGQEDALEIRCIPCLSNLNNCNTGFTFQISVTFHEDPKGRVYILDGIQDSTRDMGVQIFYESGHFQGVLQVNIHKWVIRVPYEVLVGDMYRLQLSWQLSGNLILYVNGYTVGQSQKITLPIFNYSEYHPLLVGKSWTSDQFVKITLTQMFVWMTLRDVLQQQGLVGELSTTAVPATTIPSVQTIEEHKWTLTSVSQNVIVSYGWELTLTGSPVSGTDGVELNSDDDQLEIPNLSRTCLTNPELCTDGLTIEINIKLTSLEENSIIFTTGGEVPDHPGVTLLYRFGLVHAIVSTSTHSWYVAVSHKAIITKDFCSIILSWSANTQLKVLVNKVVVGMSASSVIHTTSTTSITGNLTIGGGATRCVVNSINIWLAHIKILIQIGVIQVSSSTTTPRPTDTSTLPSVRPTIALPISTTEDGYCNPGCISSEECFDYFTDPPYPPSPQPSECPTAPSTAATTERPTTEHPTEAQTTEESTTEAPTTKEPTTEAPTTEKPTSAALTTEEPTTEQMTTAKQTTDEPTTAEPTTEEPTTEEQTTETATTEQPTTEEPTTEEPTTEEPTTEEPTTEEPTTEEPTTEEPTTEEPTTEEPTTEEPTSEEPTTEEPITEVQTTEKLTTEEPTTEEPTTSEPTSTTTAATTTTTTPKTTITTTPTTTTATTTTTTTTTTTKPPCPEPPASVGLTPEVDLTGQGQLVCYVTQVPGPGVAIRFTWQISGISQTWSKIIEAPDTGATLSASEIGIDLLDKRIICYAEVRQLSENAEWCGHVDSNPVTPSVKCPPGSTRVTVVEGKGPQSLLVEFTVPPSLLCKPVDNGQCRVDVTTTLVTKSGNEIKCSSNEIIPQAVFGVTLVGSGQKCGLTVDNDNWKNGVAFPIKATIDGIRDRQRIRTLTISVTVNGQVTSATHVLKECSVEVEAVDKDGSDSCASVNDPHIRTFDKVRFDNFIAGEFVLYQHTSIEYEVRAIYGRCFPQRTATCNCAAAVRSGDDVITFDTCDARINQVNSIRRKSVIVVDMYKNGDLTPGTRIIRRGCGQSYEVHLPSGTVVVISSSKKPFMNIHIHASAVDFEQTRGLCGDYDGDRNNDLQGHDGRRPDEFSKQWLRTETIFKGVAPLEPSVPPTYCSCLSTQEHVCAPGLDTYKCSNGGGGISGNDITDVLVSQAKTPQVQSSNRRRRALRDEQVPKDPVSLNDEISLLDDEVNYDTENATAYCRNFLESQAQVRTCERYLLDVNATEESIQNCAVDLEELGDKTWAESHLDDIIETCITDVKTDPNFWNGILDDGPELPADISAELCVENCGDNGDCVTGVCVCKDGWTGETCDIGQDTIPIVLSAVKPCDLMTSSCAEVRIEGDGFLESETLLCRFRYVTISDHVRITNEETIRPARFISLTQVICPQPVSGSARGRHALVTVSNNGVDFSTESYMHLVEKSSCQDCTVSGNMLDVSCSYLPGVCIIDDLCYSRYEEFSGDSCYRCDPDINPTRWTRTSEPECVATVEPVSTSNSCNDDTLVIVLGVLVAVLAVVSIGLSIAYLRNRKLTKSKSNLMDMESSFDTRFSQRADDDLTGNGRAARLNHHYNPTFTR